MDGIRLEAMALGQDPNVISSCSLNVDFVIQTGAGGKARWIRTRCNGSAVVRQELHGFRRLSVHL
ncbi:hypothetical protein D3C86_1178210 [compost metagenome]